MPLCCRPDNYSPRRRVSFLCLCCLNSDTALFDLSNSLDTPAPILWRFYTARAATALPLLCSKEQICSLKDQ